MPYHSPSVKLKELVHTAALDNYQYYFKSSLWKCPLHFLFSPSVSKWDSRYIKKTRK